MLRKYSLGIFHNFPRNHASANAHGRSVRKSLVQLSASFRQVAACFCSGVLRDPPTFRTVSADLPQDFPQDFPRKISAGLSTGFFQVSAGLSPGVPHGCVQRIAAKVLGNPLPLLSGRRVLRGPITLQKLVRQTVCEQMLTKRPTENFPTGFCRGPLPGVPFSLVPKHRPQFLGICGPQ